MGLPVIVLTTAGAALLAKTPIGASIPVTKWQIGTGALPSGTDVRQQTALVAQKAQVPIAQVTPDGNQCLITGQYTNTGAEAFTWEETGLFATDPDSGEILFAYGNAFGSGEPIPAGSEQLREIVFGAQLVFDAAANITATIDQGLIFATVEQMNSLERPRSARLVVGTSTAGWTAADCDYLCDGTADDVELNAAIQALPVTGGEIIILDGTYNITDWITNTEKENVTISGNGFSTILNRMITGKTKAVVMFDAANCVVKDLAVIGDKEQYPGYGIELRGNCVGCIISGVYVKGISDGGVRLDTCSNCILTNSVFEDCGGGSANVTRGSSGTMIGNVISNNTFLNAQNAIWIHGAGTSVTGNTPP